MQQILLKSIASMRHKAIWWIMMASITATMFLMLAFIGVINYLLDVYQLVSIPWVEKIIENSGILAALFFSWLLFPVTVPAIASLFEDKAAMIVEQNEYGQQEEVHSYPWVKEIGFLLIGLFLNFLFLIIYIIPVVNIVAYYLLNSWLVGKGLFMLVATRHHGKEAKKLAAKNNLTIKLYGVVLVFLSNIPFANLVAPLFGIIVMVHYSKSLRPVTE